MKPQKIKLIKLPEELEIYDPGKELPWQDAMDYAESIGMRLATLPELQIISASTDEFNHLGWTWSSSARSNNTTYAWSVYLDDGDTDYYNKTTGRSVLCVAP